ncbi:MAG TPA: ATP-dependent zinc metalloprotease FtsH [bacterium]|jgi:cell division protease FtsH|nr:MAG: ATP-dependent zinc metalloprotease FtsH [Parcubacteria group bacterium ADurb.Bin016]HNQ45100.1 ATP-dependent zinc metalloprotease FtsH [bacterium]HNU89777.1 ATP-dependent zinc metalloprotease FtsH [bacterium]HPU92075.1 ATP-dependent zinc metalloprotease FtsH [bacterium]HPX64539.1 ATP-dependent zinc metalloprotease FtsH [bacterium]
MKNLFKNFFLILIIFLTISYLFSLYSTQNTPVEKIGLEKLVQEINNEEVASITVKGDNLAIVLKDNRQQTAYKEPGESLSQLLRNYEVSPEKMTAVNVKIKNDSTATIILTTILPLLIPILVFAGLFYFIMRSAQGMNNRALSFGQTTAKEVDRHKNKITFKDVGGVKEAKEELREVVQFLKQPKKFTDLGAKIPKGILLLGSPGTGKTLLARAVAGEADVPFFSLSGSEFVEMFVGVGASRVRDLFKKAKKSAPCIIFIDEIDAVGRRRGAGLGGSHDEREQTLNQILVEMDGFETNTNVIVMTATNRPDVLDPALLRPGRFDRQVVLDEPDIKDRYDILKIHAANKPLAKDANLQLVAQRTPGFSGADLANVLNEAAILAAKKNKKIIDNEDLLVSIEKVMLGPERKSRLLSDKEKEITAYHEAGHALVTHYLPHTDPVQKISIVARGQAGGYTLKMPEQDKHLQSKQEFIEEIAVLLGGYSTENIIYNEVTTGATSDLRRATSLARRLVTDYGMSEKLGPRTFGEKEEMIFLGREIHEQRDYSEKVAEEIDQEINNFIHQARMMAEEIINNHRQEVEALAHELIAKETIEKDDFEKMVGPKPLA